ncbi:MAG TPA: polyprenyl synthetase family protein [Nitrososphaerales archaeon]|nr:polyprenyl synthetase family protein [Nitrososphaerales archaeon]
MIQTSSEEPKWLRDYVSKIDLQLAKVLGEGVSSVELTAREALSGGKRIRAVLALLWCEGMSGSPEAAVPVAAAYELAHAAALVQDDILDGSSMRRGRMSTVARYGLRSAILASNMLLALVPRQIVEHGETAQGAETLKKLFDLLGESFGSAVLGEYLDLKMAESETASEKEYLEMIRLKTGALIAASSASGAIVGSDQDSGASSKAYDFGERLGMAYQIQDDILDIVGNEAVLGKPAFTDLAGGKKNLVLIHTFDHCTDEERRLLGSLAVKNEPARMEAAKVIFERYGSIDYARRIAAGLCDDARGILGSVDLGGASGMLFELSDYLLARKY